MLKAFQHPETEVVVVVSDKWPGETRKTGLWVAVSEAPSPGEDQIKMTGRLTNSRIEGDRHIFENAAGGEVVVTMPKSTPSKVTLGGVELKLAGWVAQRSLVFGDNNLLQAVRIS